MAYWLLKSEPDVYGIDDLARCPGQRDGWEGIRNHQARNWIRDVMSAGDQAFFYHSNCRPPGIVGIVDIVTAGYPDDTAWQSGHAYFDGRSTPDNPRWYRMDVQLQRRFSRLIRLDELKGHADALGDFALLKRGNRLSVMPVTDGQWQFILALANSVTPS